MECDKKNILLVFVHAELTWFCTMRPLRLHMLAFTCASNTATSSDGRHRSCSGGGDVVVVMMVLVVVMKVVDVIHWW